MKKGLKYSTFTLKNDEVEKIKTWLLINEQKIAMGIDEFKQARPLFRAILQRDPEEINMLF